LFGNNVSVVTTRPRSDEGSGQFFSGERLRRTVALAHEQPAFGLRHRRAIRRPGLRRRSGSADIPCRSFGIHGCLPSLASSLFFRPCLQSGSHDGHLTPAVPVLEEGPCFFSWTSEDCRFSL